MAMPLLRGSAPRTIMGNMSVSKTIFENNFRIIHYPAISAYNNCAIIRVTKNQKHDQSLRIVNTLESG